MTQHMSFVFLVSVLCLEIWLSSSPLSSVSAAAAAYPPGGYFDDRTPELYDESFLKRGYGDNQEQFDAAVTDKRRLRFVRRGLDSTDQVSLSDGAVEPTYLLQRQLRDPRLRFQRRESAQVRPETSDSAVPLYLMAPRQIRGPRLRFQKREAVPPPTYDTSSHAAKSDDDDEEAGHHGGQTQSETLDEKTGSTASGSGANDVLHSRKRRSKRLSVNNDLQVITDMVLRQEYQRRQRELRNLIQRMKDVGKRSAAKQRQPTHTDLDLEESASEDRESLKLVKSLKDSLEDLLAV